MRALALAVGIAVALAGRAAEAQDAIPVTWNAPEGCPERGVVVAEIERLLGEVDWGKWSSLDAVLTAAPADVGWTVTVTTAEPAGERVIQGASCDEVAAAGALIVAMTIDPDFVPPEEPPPKPKPEPEPEPGPKPPPPPAPRTPLLWTLGANVTAETGTLPGVGPGAGLAAAAHYGPWRAEVSGSYWLERREELDDPAGIGGDLSMWLAAARGCRDTVAHVEACIGFEAGRIRGRAVGVMNPRTNRATWLAPVAGVAYSLNVSELLSIRVSGDAAVALRRPRFGLTDGAVDIYQPERVAGRVLVGAEVQIP